MVAFLLQPWVICIVLSICASPFRPSWSTTARYPCSTTSRSASTAPRTASASSRQSTMCDDAVSSVALSNSSSPSSLFFRIPVIEGIIVLIPLVILCLGAADLVIYTRVLRIGKRDLLKPALVAIFFEAAFAGLYYALFSVAFPAGLQPLRGVGLRAAPPLTAAPAGSPKTTGRPAHRHSPFVLLSCWAPQCEGGRMDVLGYVTDGSKGLQEPYERLCRPAGRHMRAPRHLWNRPHGRKSSLMRW